MKMKEGKKDVKMNTHRFISHNYFAIEENWV